ncbi:UGSC family (seleno)protein [Nesterenkonia flava]|uniref:UGSC family (Seleno)protein n=1 Tax=Nesterenkonia flava TaxID=469799 RepID=A0ABU1FPI8_9MICC|nr:UGSC family (seleno)protein [Nesterenkonia flava]MDR5710559.1 UGSC family (seleno)protein [Nesterenkonia flava]
MSPNGILDPTQLSGAPTETHAAQAERRPSLEGLRVGLLDNTKHNALLFLKEIGNLLTQEYGAKEVSIIETKKNFSVPVDDEIISRYKESSDVVVTGIGDCGSCSAAAVADGINFEKGGLPAAVVLTDAFDTTGRTMAKLQGDEDYEWITTEHPVAPLTEEQVKERARQLAPSIVKTLTAP